MPQRNGEKELIELERQYWQAIKARDAKTAMRLSDDPCLVVGAQGVGELKREALGEMLKRAPYTLRDYELSEVKVRFVRDDVALVAYKVHEDLDVEGAPLSLDAADSSTWVRRDGSWVCALHTEALSGDPFGRDRGARGVADPG